MNIDISVVIPVLNEEPVLPLLLQALESNLIKITENYEIIFVDDGSTDSSFNQIKKVSSKDPRIKGISFIRNFGHQCALIAGILNASGEYVVTMDADLQHPPSLLPDLIHEIRKGYDLVGTVRVVSGTSPVKEFLSESFYKFFNMISSYKLVPNSADYRIVSRTVADDIKKQIGKDIFLRGFVASRGYHASYLEFSAKEREYGISKYSMLKMFDLALLGITSFSYLPLRLAYLLLGITLFILIVYSVLYFASIFGIVLFDGEFSLFRVLELFLFSGLFLNLAIVGEYVSRIHKELKNEELYTVKEKIGTWM